jgi:hypothetical protein
LPISDFKDPYLSEFETDFEKKYTVTWGPRGSIYPTHPQSEKRKKNFENPGFSGFSG